MKLTLPNPIMVSETIASQHDDFGHQLEKVITLMVQSADQGHFDSAEALEKHPGFTQLETLVKNRLNMSIKIFSNTDMPAAIMPFYSNVNHIFLPDMWRGWIEVRDQRRFLDSIVGRKGSVSLSKARLGGFYSEYQHQVYLNIFMLSQQYNMNAPEIAAVLLHELGHGFYGCYYADRVDETNQVLAALARKVLNANEKPDLQYVYLELKKVNDQVTKEEVDKLLNGPKVVAGATWFKIVNDTVRSLTLDSTYNRSAFEQRADNFATRFGYGRYLILGLDKLPDFTGERSFAMRAFSYVMDILTMVALLVLVGVALGAGSVIGGIYFIAMSYLYMVGQGEHNMDYTYDNLKFRYLRVRQDAVDQLKSRNLPKKYVKELLENIYTTDEILKSVVQYRTLSQKVANFIFSGARRAKASIEDQQLMEALSANDLFRRSAEFSVHA